MKISYSKVDCYYVYKHTNKLNNKVYIGITKQSPVNRWKNGYGYVTQQLFHRAIQKYGWDNFKHEILFDNLTKEEAEQKEIELIAQYKSNNSLYGYNIDNGGNTIGTFSKQHCDKISKALTGRTGILSSNFGKKYTDEHRKNISKSRKGKPSNRLGKKVSIETRNKMSESAKNRKHLNRAIQVICIEKNECFTSSYEASRIYKINPSSIIKCCKGKRKTAGGYHWKYASEVCENEIFI